MQNYAEAISTFDKALIENRNRHSPDGQAYALDGKATLLIETARHSFSEETLTDADSYLDQALFLLPHYDSALYHKAEILAERVIHQIDHNDCNAAKTIVHARSAFDTVTGYRSSFAVAYSSQAVLLAQWLNFLLFKDAGCIDQPASEIDALEAQADDLFGKSIANDNSSAYAWFQWGLLTRERQYESLTRPVTEKMRTYRSYFLDLAIFRMNYGIQLYPRESWPARQLAETLKYRADLAPTEERTPYLKKALAAACLPYRLRPAGDVKERDYLLNKLARSFGSSDEDCKTAPSTPERAVVERLHDDRSQTTTAPGRQGDKGIGEARAKTNMPTHRPRAHASRR